MTKRTYSSFVAKVMGAEKKKSPSKKKAFKVKSTAHGFELDARSLGKSEKLKSQLEELDRIDELEAAS